MHPLKYISKKVDHFETNHNIAPKRATPRDSQSRINVTLPEAIARNLSNRHIQEVGKPLPLRIDIKLAVCCRDLILYLDREVLKGKGQ